MGSKFIISKTQQRAGSGTPVLTRKRLAEIQQRKTQLRDELSAAEEAKLEEIEEEIQALEEELEQLQEEVEGAGTDEAGKSGGKKREGAAEDETAEEKIEELEAEIAELKEEEEQLKGKMDKRSKRAPENTRNRGGAGSEAEQRARTLRQTRAVTITGSNIVQPKKTGGINDSFDTVSSIVDMVKAEDCRGMGEYEVAYEIVSATAEKTAENTEVALSDPQFGKAMIKPITVATYSEISRECMKLTDLNYLQKVEQSARLALRKKVSEFIINSDAVTNATFFGFNQAGALDGTGDVSISAIDATTLRKIAMNYGGDEGIEGNAALILNKKDLVAFGDVRGTNEKKYVYEITPDAANPNTGIIQDGGLSVKYVLNKNLPALSDSGTSAEAFCMVYGTPTCYELGIFSDYTIIVSEEAALRRRMIAILGEVMIGGNVTIHNGFVRVKKPA